MAYLPLRLNLLNNNGRSLVVVMLPILSTPIMNALFRAPCERAWLGGGFKFDVFPTGKCPAIAPLRLGKISSCFYDIKRKGKNPNKMG